MTDNKVVLEWALELGKQAFTEARGGNTAMLNKLGANPGLKMFLDNVVGTSTVKAHEFASYYPGKWSEVVGLYEDVQKAEAMSQTVDKVATLESKIDKLESMLAEFIQSQKPAIVEEAEEVEAPKKGKKPAKTEVVETDAVEESEAEATEADGESEA